jgi:hypothetical protein
MSAPVENLVKRLQARRSGKGWIAKCPAHDDHKPSLSIDEGSDGRALVICHAGCNLNAVLAAAGMTPADLFVKSPTTTYQRKSSNGAFDWQTCVSALKPREIVRLGNERWYSRAFCTRLHQDKHIGLYNGCIAFPVRSNGAVIGAHYRVEDGWRYHPLDIKAAPFIIGDLSIAKQIHVFESQWDMLALADRTDLYQNEFHAFIATRGAGNTALVKGLIPPITSVLAWPQNDAAGEKWVTDLCTHAGTKVAKALVPAPHKDLNAWTAAGASAEDIYASFFRNELYKPGPTESAALIASQSVNLAALLEEICNHLKRYVVFAGEAQPVAVALWAAHTWAIDAFDYTPYLQVTAPEKQCGKTRVLDCLEPVTPKAWRVISPSEAVLYHKIEVDKPTLLLDETDTLFCKGNDDRGEFLRSLLNAGFERGAQVPRCVNKGEEIKEYAVFCPKAFAGIGSLPDTVTDRCVPIRLRKKRRDEKTKTLSVFESVKPERLPVLSANVSKPGRKTKRSWLRYAQRGPVSPMHSVTGRLTSVSHFWPLQT